MILRSVFYAAAIAFMQDWDASMHRLFQFDYSVFVGCWNPSDVRAIKRRSYTKEKAERRELQGFVWSCV